MNLLNLLRNQLDNNLSDQMASFLGEEPRKIRRALDAMFPSIMSVFVKKSSERPGAQTIMNHLEQEGYDGSMLNTLYNTFHRGDEVKKMMGSGQKWSEELLGNKKQKLANAVADYSQITAHSSSQLIDMCMPLVASVIGKQVKSRNLDTSGLMYLLSTQKGHIGAAIPNGFANATVLQSLAKKETPPTPKTTPKVTTTKTTTIHEKLANRKQESTTKKAETQQKERAAYTYAEEKKGLLSYLPFILGGLLLITLLIFGVRACNKNKQVADNPKKNTSPSQSDKKKDDATKNLADDKSDENTTNVVKTNESPSDNYNDYPNSSPTPVGEFKAKVQNIVNQGGYSGQTVAMEGLQFRNNSPIIRGSSRHIVNELAEVMRNQPNMRIKVEAAPVTRAISVKKGLMDAGVNRNRIETTKGSSSEVKIHLY